uniref:Hepatocyte growth factor-regulated tyrosine kinase substrate n=1 Tax=Rousettus aegyptiacus TaxID=9407 RepID=A0A7J8G8A3_ROUAE|nr:hepatocyte growth factor-regulated tyrosine kinase substrate [Rousettus aegyptiacus]
MAQTRRPEGFLGLEATAGLRVHLFPGARRWTHCRHSVGTLAGSPRRRPCGGGPGARRSVPTAPRFSRKAEGKAPPAAELPPEYLTSPLSQQSQLPPKRDETALQEEEELQLALALSQSEAEEKERMRQKSAYAAYPKAEPAPVASSAPPASSLYSSPVNSSAPLAEDMDPELARYLNRNYWEKKQEEARKSPTPSAPVPLTEPAAQPAEGHAAPASVAETPLLETDSQPTTSPSGPFSEQQYQNGDAEESHAQFLKALQNAVSTFVNRMKSNHVRGRSITNDSAVLSLFQSINGMHPQLLELLNQLDERRLYYEGLQDKLAQIRDARGALSALREEHREKLPPSLAGAVLLLLALLLPPWCVPAPCEQGGSPFVLACWLLAPHPTLRPIFICLLSLGLGLGAEGRREGSLATSPQPGVSGVP